MKLTTSTDLQILLPPWYREVFDYQAINGALEPLLEEAQGFLEQVLLNFFPQTMDVGTVEMWEDTLHIVPDPSYEDLDFRRARIINRISTKPPYTLAFLYQKLDELIGPGLWSVDVDHPNYTLYIESNAQDQAYSQEVEFTVNHIKPAHIAYVHRGVIIKDILVNEGIIAGEWGDWNYKLGSWQLGLLPFREIVNEEVLKTASQTSVQPAMLNLLAGYTSDDVVSARINGTVNITDITKSVSANTLTVTYDVLPTQASEVTSAELLAEDGTVLFSATGIYMAITDQVNIKHTINIEEGE